RNITSPKQVTKLVTDLRALAPGRTLLVATDQEGGKVARLSPATGFPAGASQAQGGGRGDRAPPRRGRDQREPRPGRPPERQSPQSRDRGAESLVLGRSRR